MKAVLRAACPAALLLWRVCSVLRVQWHYCYEGCAACCVSSDTIVMKGVLRATCPATLLLWMVCCVLRVQRHSRRPFISVTQLYNTAGLSLQRCYSFWTALFWVVTQRVVITSTRSVTTQKSAVLSHFATEGWNHERYNLLKAFPKHPFE